LPIRIRWQPKDEGREMDKGDREGRGGGGRGAEDQWTEEDFRRRVRERLDRIEQRLDRIEGRGEGPRGGRGEGARGGREEGPRRGRGGDRGGGRGGGRGRGERL
jgi:hypothetical protein